ncbi:hypothetical protein PGT21_027240 [Puccinia graminis f. sp. tritici]|uniref:Uncharacterized protein n=1 Tax=Puccinia graminis f. sp. tritici TaxID=56615 RepID=A0A5B0QJ75_PUCGR|nr:hypothetical protein PGT21_027240 [Puccinia graminis f. sp. tritici]
MIFELVSRTLLCVNKGISLFLVAQSYTFVKDSLESLMTGISDLAISWRAYSQGGFGSVQPSFQSRPLPTASDPMILQFMSFLGPAYLSHHTTSGILVKSSG